MLLNLRFSIKAMMPFLMSLKGEILFLSPFKGFLIGFSQKYLIYLGIDFRASQPQLLETLRERGSQKSKVKSQKSKVKIKIKNHQNKFRRCTERSRSGLVPFSFWSKIPSVELARPSLGLRGCVFSIQYLQNLTPRQPIDKYR